MLCSGTRIRNAQSLRSAAAQPQPQARPQLSSSQAGAQFHLHVLTRWSRVRQTFSYQWFMFCFQSHVHHRHRRCTDLLRPWHSCDGFVGTGSDWRTHQELREEGCVGHEVGECKCMCTLLVWYSIKIVAWKRRVHSSVGQLWTVCNDGENANVYL